MGIVVLVVFVFFILKYIKKIFFKKIIYNVFIFLFLNIKAFAE